MKALIILISALSISLSATIVKAQSPLSKSALSQRLQQKKEFNHSDSLSFGEKLYFGGDFGLSFGKDETFVNVSPLVGYRITDQFSAGLGVTFQYLRDQIILVNSSGASIEGRTNVFIYGGRGFNRLNATKNFFFQFEAEMLNTEVRLDSGTRREWVPGVWAGAGYQINMGKLAGVNLMILYNLAYDENRSPYGLPFDVRVGFQF